MKTKLKLSIYGIVLLLLVSVSTLFLCIPKPLKKISALSSTEQSALNSILTFEVMEYSDDLTTTKKYDEVFGNVTMFSLYYDLLTKNKTVDELDMRDSEREIVKEKYTSIELLGNNLEQYLQEVYGESKNLKTISDMFVYEDITEVDEQKKNDLTAVKNANIKFWDNEIYLSYVNASKGENSSDITGETLARTAKENIDKCLNKLVALEIYPEKLAYFKTEIDKLPAIIDVKRENLETLTKLKKELDEFYLTYAIHLDSESKSKVEGYKWQVDKSLEQISNSDNNWAIFFIILIIGVIAGVVMLARYFVIPKLQKKRGQRK